MSKKWLIVWLVSFFVLAGTLIYLFIVYRQTTQKQALLMQAPSIQPEDIRSRALEQGFDYTKDTIIGTILAKTADEDGNPAFKLYVSWPPGAPIFDKNVIIAQNCSSELSNLVSVNPNAKDPKSSFEILARGINIYEQASEGDVMRAFFLNQYCSVIGGACELLKS